MESKYYLRAICLLALFVSFLPVNHADALALAAPPPLDMFQLPWDLGKAWVALDGVDNGSKRPTSSSHNHTLGGAIDFAPRRNMVTGEDTSNFWVAAAAAGTVIQTATCYVTLAHADGWITQYQFLGNIQVKLGDAVARNQRLGIIADGVKYKYCPGFQEINVPHVHFILRPSIIGASFAGWEVKYNSLFNSTTFTKGGTTVGLFSPLLNVFDSPTTPTPTATSTIGPTATQTPTATVSSTPTFTGAFVSTAVNPQSVTINETALATVSLNNVPAEDIPALNSPAHIMPAWRK
jgi:murein DD-endopeptidase MepM/ murein hydrolase activator NlpD